MRCTIDLAGLSFLVVDDSEVVRRALRAVLGGLGTTRVSEAADGQAALDQLTWDRPDIIVCDWQMQPMGGEAFMHALRSDPDVQLATLPVIMLTSFTSPARALAAARFGVNEFLPKPLSAAALYRRIERVVTEGRPFVRVPGYFGPLPRGVTCDGAGLRRVAEAMRTPRPGRRAVA